MEEQKEQVKAEKEQKEVKVEKEEEQTIEAGFDAGMESIGGSLDVDTTLDRIFEAVDN